MAGAGGAAGAAGTGWAGAGSPVAGWIDPDLREEKDEDSVCGLCFGVMVKPASGCPEGHCFCKPCYVKALARNKSCPSCRARVKDAKKLVPNRTAANLIAKMWLRCELAEGKEASTDPPRRSAPSSRRLPP